MKTKFAMSMIIAVSLATATTANAQTYGFVEIESTSADFPRDLTFYGSLGYHFNEEFSASAFFAVTGSWAQAYAGPVWKPDEYMEFSLSLGAEQGSHGVQPRYATSVWAGYAGFSFLGILELNNHVFAGDASGLWYDLNLEYKLNDWLDLGVKDRRPTGVGPSIRVSYSGIGLWLSWMPVSAETADWQPKVFLFGVRATMP